MPIKLSFYHKGKIISTLSGSEKENIQGKKVSVSKQVELPDNIISETTYFTTDTQYHFLPKYQTERTFLNQISNITLNYSVEDKKLEDLYQLLIKKSK